LVLLLIKKYNGQVQSIPADELATMTTKIRGSGANSKIEGDTPRDAVQQEKRGDSVGKVADNQRLTPLNIALQTLSLREATIPLFLPRYIVDMAETHTTEFLGEDFSLLHQTFTKSASSVSMWEKLLQERKNDHASNPLMISMGMYSTIGFNHDRLDRTLLHEEAMKYHPDSERDRNMQCFKYQLHMCLTLGLERLPTPSGEYKPECIRVSTTDSNLLLFPTKSGVRNAISLQHHDSITKDDITTDFVSQKKWREINGENIVENKCYYLEDDRYRKLGTVSRMKPMPKPSRANDVGPLYFQWSFGFDRLNKDVEWCRINKVEFSNAIFQSVFHTLTGRVSKLEQLSNHLRQIKERNNETLPNDPNRPIYPTTTSYMEAIYFIRSTLKQNTSSMSNWVLDQFSNSIPNRFKNVSIFESIMTQVANKAMLIATKILNEEDTDLNRNKRETQTKPTRGD